MNHIAFSETSVTLVCKETKRCLLLPTVYRHMHNGWSAMYRKVPRITPKDWDMTDKLTLDNGLLFKSSRTVILPALRQPYLHDLHGEYAGITTCQLVAIYSPGIDSNIMTNLHQMFKSDMMENFIFFKIVHTTNGTIIV